MIPDAWRHTPGGKLRARAAGIPFDGTPGEHNAITDVSGVAVGYSTLVEGSGKLEVGKGPIRTGVTAILPQGIDHAASVVWAGVFSLNGNGEMTAFPWVDETGRCEGPIMITNTHAVGVVRDATIAWLVSRNQEVSADDGQFWLPVVAETYDGELNDINGGHVRPEHAVAAIESALGGRIEEGSVGGGTGMRAYQFKAGTGTASRQVTAAGRDFTVGALVQANFGRRYMCRIAGIPVGTHFPPPEEQRATQETGSLIVVIATDAPLLPHQLRRLAKRPAMAMARSGGVSAHYSGDLFIAFTTENARAVAESDAVTSIEYLPDQQLTPVFEAAIQAADEAIINSFVGTAAMTGINGHTIEAFPVEAVSQLLRHHRLFEDIH
jgi:L-aminopeptidase/D-esterase-like protein